VGKEFSIGSVRLYGIRLCEPCSYLAGLLDDKVMENMVHKAGLRAQILSSGSIYVNQEFQLESTSS
jgi:MOSC domain-containing protein YiiM